MIASRFVRYPLTLVLICVASAMTYAQSFRVQCPDKTPLHSDGSGIKCQQVSGGDGFATMGDGTQTYLFGFGPLSGLTDIANGLPGTETNKIFNLGSADPYGNGS